ncbi:MAG: NUDIX domain-containing protein [Patescibacteria group bacterium]
MIIDKLAWIHLKDKKILVTLSKGKDAWFMPGGKRFAGESDEQTLIREVREELNLDLVPSSIRYYGTFQAQAYGKPIDTFVRLTCYTADFNGIPTPSNEVAQCDYFNYAQKSKTTPASLLLFDDLKQKNLID